MTVIVYDGVSLAADGRMSSPDGILYSDDYNKLHECNILGLGKCVVGLAGAVPLIGPYLEHLEEEGFTPFEHPLMPQRVNAEGGLQGLAVTRKGKCYEFSADGGWFEVQGFTSIGSGNLIAGHFLKKGQDALTAIKEACETEMSCGGTIVVYDIEARTFTKHIPERP